MPLRDDDLDEEPDLNLTPLIDVIFVILITFIVIAPLLEVDRVALPQRPDDGIYPTASTASPIVLHLHANEQIVLNGAPTTLPQLPTQLQTLLAAHTNATPQLYIDRNSRFGTYQLVKGELEAVGFAELEVILEPQ